MFTKIIRSALSCHSGRKSWMKSFNQVSLTGTLFQNTIALCIVVMDTEHEMLINFFLWSINLFYFSELFDVLCKKRPHRRICLLRKVLMTRLNLFHFLFNQRPLLVSQLNEQGTSTIIIIFAALLHQSSYVMPFYFAALLFIVLISVNRVIFFA